MLPVWATAWKMTGGTVRGGRVRLERRDQGGQDDERDVGKQRVGRARHRDPEDFEGYCHRGTSSCNFGLVGEPGVQTARSNRAAIATL